MICLAGSLSCNNATDNSDIDLFFLLDKPINDDYNLKYEEIDIWWNTPYQILTVYRGFLAQTPWGVANF
jgi:predicted nucleotidyltransferase